MKKKTNGKAFEISLVHGSIAFSQIVVNNLINNKFFIKNQDDNDPFTLAMTFSPCNHYMYVN